MTLILLVEDSKFLRSTGEGALAKAGYSVMSADDVEQAVRAAQEQVPDLILTRAAFNSKPSKRNQDVEHRTPRRSALCRYDVQYAVA